MRTNGEFIAEVLSGQADGERFIRGLDRFSSPDALANKLVEIMASDGPGNPKLHGFARAIQKAIERAGRRVEGAIG